MKNIIKDMLAYILLIVVSMCWLFIFILIARYGEFGVYEPNKVILIAEIVLCAAMMALGIERLHSFIKRFRK